ncbi:hypothetical protein SAMN04488498_1279 [Mesorhizobium albiziae]|uniref:Uncharacterized protein n=1 Tax=Neomesorhizobium albiziae TaxID=335020 RepID=A0A1I4EK59_9HYPH|nr:hypothetical protein SAMN04488498_1279 [Mesorhizobium albiziae]
MNKSVFVMDFTQPFYDNLDRGRRHDATSVGKFNFDLVITYFGFTAPIPCTDKCRRRQVSPLLALPLQHRWIDGKLSQALASCREDRIGHCGDNA